MFLFVNSVRLWLGNARVKFIEIKIRPKNANFHDLIPTFAADKKLEVNSGVFLKILRCLI